MKLLKLTVCLLFITSCKSRDQYNLNVITSVNESLEMAQKHINNSCHANLKEMENKVAEPITFERAKLFLPKMNFVYSNVESIVNFIDSLSMLVKEDRKHTLSRQNQSILYMRLANFKHEVLCVDSVVSKEGAKFIIIGTKAFDSLPHTDESFSKYFFYNLSTEATIAVLNKFKLDVLYFGNVILNWLNLRVGSLIDRFDNFGLLFSISSSIVKPGETLEIAGGVGSFSLAAQPEMEIEDKIIKPNAGSMFIYPIKAKSTPGNYIIPFKVKYYDENGLRVTREIQIGYTVIN